MRSLLVAALLLGGCARSALEAYALQPRPVRDGLNPDQLAQSTPLYIHQRDPDLPRDFQLRSSAQFTVVSLDRIRFHVGIARQDEEEADARGWKVRVEDESGHVYTPTREVVTLRRLALNWRLWPYSPGDSWCPSPPCVSRVIPGYEAFEGRADYVLAVPGLLATHQKLVLILERRGQQLRFAWTFGDGNEVHHYGRTRSDDELGTILVPGPYTEEASRDHALESW